MTFNEKEIIIKSSISPVIFLACRGPLMLVNPGGGQGPPAVLRLVGVPQMPHPQATVPPPRYYSKILYYSKYYIIQLNIILYSCYIIGISYYIPIFHKLFYMLTVAVFGL